ncbi:MAG TPA: dienelactone hydrolase family protein [Vicinamibacterales bacterium]
MQSGLVVDAVRIHDGGEVLDADLHLPEHARGLVIFAHGSGSSRFSSRNRQVAESLNTGHYATLLLDLLTQAEERIDLRTAEFRFDIPRLGRRVVAATDWASNHPVVSDLPIGYFGASTGAAAALIAAAERPNTAAVVSRGGRPDLAGDALPIVRAPTLLIVGGDDEQVIELNEAAMRRMRAPAELAIVPHATHLFEEPGTLEEVQRLALDWFARHVKR